MRLGEPLSEEEMVAHFLRTEIHSARFGDEIRRLLERDQIATNIIEQPDLSDPAENAQRADLLGEFRGYRRNADVFTDLPDDVQWWRAFVSREDLERVKYLNDEYWIEFSGGSRLVSEAAQRILSGMMPDVADGYRSLAQAFARGDRFPEMILLYNPKEDELVLLEGHVRMTAYLLFLRLLKNTPPELPILVGCSDHMRK